MIGGMRIADNAEGVAALRALSAGLRDSVGNAKSAVSSASSVVYANREGLGSYANRAEECFEDIQITLDQYALDVSTVMLRLHSLASALEEYINSNSGGGSGN